MNPVLDIRGLNKTFGALAICRNINLTLNKGARHALIGPNGAGKTTLVNLIAGTMKPSGGKILLNGEDITAMPQAARAARGMARTFQINTLFSSLSVLENIYLAIAEREGISRQSWRPAGAAHALIAEAIALLDRLGLADDAATRVSMLAYGRQRLIEIAIALAQRPRLLLLDEPAAGVAAAESHVILDAIERLDPEIAVLVIEHDMDIVFRIASRISVMVAGGILTEGTPDEIANDARVRAVYLGQDPREVAP